MPLDRFVQAVTEAANRAEVTTLFIRYGYRVYRPEADIEGEDLVVRAPNGVRMPGRALCGVQLKGRPIVDWKRYGNRDLWMLFPSASYKLDTSREWFLIPHDTLFAWVKERHGSAPKWADFWTYPTIGRELETYLAAWRLRVPDPGLPLALTADPNPDRFVFDGGGKVYREGELVVDLDQSPE